jgi:indole-3-glycerol phosphate synthase/phosphoribosylanthranilate isomerase
MSKDVLSQIVARKRDAVMKLRAQNHAAAWRERAMQCRQHAERHRFRQTLEADFPALKVIAEFKRMSPSRGVIRSDLSPSYAASCYERSGACAISVLTDQEYFGGSLVDLIAVRASTRLPILRKDFIIDPVQIYEAASAGADAVLLIAAILEHRALERMRMIAEDELGLDALVEVHTSDELRRALNAGARLIGVNNRDLRTSKVSTRTSERLIGEAPRHAVMISESGLRNAEQLRRLHALGFRGFLIGEKLMQATDPASALRELIGSVHFQRAASGISADGTTSRQDATAARRMHALPTQIKICGITNVLDAVACAELGADLIGLNFYRQSPRYIEPRIAREIVAAMPHGVCAVGVFVNASAAEVRETAAIANVRCVQLHGHVPPETCRALAQEFRVIRALCTDNQFRPQDAQLFSGCDVLIDAHHSRLHGGTGQTCDWPAARATLPFARFLLLSGGLNTKNVRAAIAAVAPHAVDVCSGVESAPGVKDHRALEKFIAAVRA